MPLNMSTSRLSCFFHCRRNIKQQLRDRHFPDAAIKSVLDDVFGVQQDEVFAEGLVDCTSDSEFSEKLQVLEKRWSDIEECDSQINSGFYNWFIQHKSDNQINNVETSAGGSRPWMSTTAVHDQSK